jgi:predicted HAD superfamily Cof-like phosphohydrolase
MRVSDLNLPPDVAQELEAWGSEMSRRFEDGIDATTAAEPPLMRLRRLRYRQRRTQEEIAEAVNQARATGESWQKIGGALGVTAQAARQRYRRPA